MLIIIIDLYLNILDQRVLRRKNSQVCTSQKVKGCAPGWFRSERSNNNNTTTTTTNNNDNTTTTDNNKHKNDNNNANNIDHANANDTNNNNTNNDNNDNNKLPEGSGASEAARSWSLALSYKLCTILCLYYNILYYSILYYTILYQFILHYIKRCEHYTITYYTDRLVPEMYLCQKT